MLCLVVDDDENSRFISKKIMQHSLGFQVVAVANGKEGIDVCINQKPSVILLDWMMPEMDGMQFMRKLKELPFDVRYKMKILMTTAKGYKEDVEEAIANGVDGYLKKPFDITNVIKQLIHVGVYR